MLSYTLHTMKSTDNLEYNNTYLTGSRPTVVECVTYMGRALENRSGLKKTRRPEGQKARRPGGLAREMWQLCGCISCPHVLMSLPSPCSLVDQLLEKLGNTEFLRPTAEIPIAYRNMSACLYSFHGGLGEVY